MQQYVEVRLFAKRLLGVVEYHRQHGHGHGHGQQPALPLNSIHGLIEMGIDFETECVFDVTLCLHGVSFAHECNSNSSAGSSAGSSGNNNNSSSESESGGLLPFMAMAASKKYQLHHVYNMAMKTCMHYIRKEHDSNLGKRKSVADR